jgi:EAL domain-containing protein (putative c-di-GMP-specific phosphodiesterase class I)/FixJ family two-component response regulator
MMPERFAPRSRRAFVIDDEDGICKFVSMALASFDVEAATFSSAETAIAALPGGRPDFIFLDIALKGSDAIDVIRTLGERQYCGVVQVMSGSDVALLEDVRRIGTRHGLRMLAPLRKPMRMEAIRNAISAAPASTQPSALPEVLRSVRTELDEALRSNWLELWYQPKINLRTRTIDGIEGLVRCRHPAHGVLAPAAFLPGASEDSLSCLTEFVVVSALHDGADLANAGLPLKIAVNTNVGALTRLQLSAIVRKHQPASHQWPGLLLEVTEGEVVNDVDIIHEMATQLRLYGITLAIDDFGEGHSSFARLRELPFSELKLDRSFVDACAENPTNAGICKAVIDLAHHFGVTAVAEGIEREADLLALVRMGCDIGQGYFLARPMPKPDLMTKIAAQVGQPWFN